MSEDWKWLDEIESAIERDFVFNSVGLLITNQKTEDLVLDNSKKLIACIKEMREQLEILKSAFKHHEVIGGTLHAKWESQINETLNRCARGEFEK